MRWARDRGVLICAENHHNEWHYCYSCHWQCGEREGLQGGVGYHLLVVDCVSVLQFPMTALREIRILKLLKHENVVNLVEICRSKREPYLRH